MKDLMDKFNAWCEEGNVILLPSQRNFAETILQTMEADKEFRLFMCGGYGSGKTFTFETVERFIAETKGGAE